MVRIFIAVFMSPTIIFLVCPALPAEDFYLNSAYNKGTLRFEIDNDFIWNVDSNFTNGWSLQYHSKRYKNWEEANVSGFVRWMGRYIATLNNKDSIVRTGHSIGQNMITPGDLTAVIQQEDDLPYAGTLTYSLSLQSFNRKSARNIQLNAGVLGSESFAEEFQKFIHNDLDRGDDPRGWDGQRKKEPIINIGYQDAYRLLRIGDYTNNWGGQLTFGSSIALGNLFTGVELSFKFRYGWNILEGFETNPAPPGVGGFHSTYLPKPSFASPHSIEMALGIRGTALGYSVVYDGSIITDDGRDVEREDFTASVLLGIIYHYHSLFSVRLYLQTSTDLLKEDYIPDPVYGKKKTHADLSYGALIIDFHF